MAAWAFSLVWWARGYSLAVVLRLLIAMGSLDAEYRINEYLFELNSSEQERNGARIIL